MSWFSCRQCSHATGVLMPPMAGQRVPYLGDTPRTPDARSRRMASVQSRVAGVRARQARWPARPGRTVIRCPDRHPEVSRRLFGRSAQQPVKNFAVLRVMAVCATQEWTGGPLNPWALNMLTTTAITLRWEWSPMVTVPVTARLLVVDLAAVGTGVLGTLLPRLVFECLPARLGFVLLRRSGRRVDELWERRPPSARGTPGTSTAPGRWCCLFTVLMDDGGWPSTRGR
jgi:hypothetical protein